MITGAVVSGVAKVIKETTILCVGPLPALSVAFNCTEYSVEALKDERVTLCSV